MRDGLVVASVGLSRLIASTSPVSQTKVVSSPRAVNWSTCFAFLGADMAAAAAAPRLAGGT